MRSHPLSLTTALTFIALIGTSSAFADGPEELSLDHYIKIEKRPGVGEVARASIRIFKAPKGQPAGGMFGGLMGGNEPPAPRPEIVLISMVHLAEKSFFDAINQELAKADLVLYEEMGDENMRMASGSMIAEATGLEFQGSAIKMDSKTWRSADLPQKALMQAMGIGPKAYERMTRMMKMMRGSGQHPNRQPAPSNPMLEQMLPTRDKILAQLRSGDAGLGGMPKQAMDLILHQRNAICIGQMTTASYESELKRVVVLYGAAHMPGVEQYLIHRLGYRHIESSWLDAIYADPEAAKKPVRKPRKPGRRAYY